MQHTKIMYAKFIAMSSTLYSKDDAKKDKCMSLFPLRSFDIVLCDIGRINMQQNNIIITDK